MDYGAAYRQPQQPQDDDSSPNARQSQYRPFRYAPSHQSPVSPPASSWSISPVALQQSLPPMSQVEGASETRNTFLGSTIFDSNAAPNHPYLENFAWENATEFRPTRVEPSVETPNPPPLPTENIVFEECNTRKYFRDPRFNPEPWMPGVWPRLPWLGLGALLAITVCAYNSPTA